MGDDREQYRRSTKCEGGSCLEVGAVEQNVHIRDSTRPAVELRISREDFAGFLDAVKRGEFDSAS